MYVVFINRFIIQQMTRAQLSQYYGVPPQTFAYLLTKPMGYWLTLVIVCMCLLAVSLYIDPSLSLSITHDSDLSIISYIR